MSWPECLIILIFIIITWIGGDSQRIATQASPDHRTLEEGQLWSEPPWFNQSDDETLLDNWQWQPGFVSFSISSPWTLWLKPLTDYECFGRPTEDWQRWSVTVKHLFPVRYQWCLKGGWLLSLSWSKQGNCSARRKNMTIKEKRVGAKWYVVVVPTHIGRKTRVVSL